MGNVVDHRRTASSLAAREPLRGARADPFVARASHAIGGLRGWFTRRYRSRHVGGWSACPDDHTLNDIGLSRIDMRGPKDLILHRRRGCGRAPKASALVLSTLADRLQIALQAPGHQSRDGQAIWPGLRSAGPGKFPCAA